MSLEMIVKSAGIKLIHGSMPAESQYAFVRHRTCIDPKRSTPMA
jgi:hypothetical protein